MPQATAENLSAAVKFKVTFDGTEIPEDQLLTIVVEQDLMQPAMAVVTVRNEGHAHSNDRTHGQAIEIKVGANNTVLFKGEVVGIEPIYMAGGETKCIIRCFDKLNRLGRGRKSRTFLDQSDNDIVGTIAGDHGLSPQCGTDVNIRHKHVYQHNQSDLEFLRLRAARIGYVVWVEDRTLHFNKPKTDEDSGVELTRAQSDLSNLLKSFTARMSSANLVNKVTVRGWDPDGKKEIVGEASVASSKLGATTGPSAANSFGEVKTYQVDHPIFSVEEAKALAEARLGEHLMSYITGEGEASGHPEMKPGMVIKVTVNADKPDDRFNGKYFVQGCTHRYAHAGPRGTGGFNTSFRVSRDAEKGQ